MDENFKPYTWKQNALVIFLALLGLFFTEAVLKLSRFDQLILNYLGYILPNNILLGLFIGYGLGRPTLAIAAISWYAPKEHYWKLFVCAFICVSVLMGMIWDMLGLGHLILQEVVEASSTAGVLLTPYALLVACLVKWIRKARG